MSRGRVLLQPEPTRSSTILSFAAFLQPKQEISHVDFSRDGTLEAGHLEPF